MNELITSSTNTIIASNTIAADLIPRWLQFIDVKQRSAEAYSRAVKLFLGYLAENCIDRPSRQDIINYRTMLEQHHKPTTVQSYIIAIRLFFQWLELENIYPNIADHVKGAKIDNKDHKKDYLNKANVKKLLESIDRSSIQGRRDYAMILLMVSCGLRTIELSRANIEDFRASGENTVLFLQGKGKDEKTDFAIIPPVVEDAIRAYLATRKAPKGTDALFVSVSRYETGSRLTTRSISRITKNALVNVGLNSSRLTAHSLRHTAVTLALKAGIALDEVQQFARHANIATTMVYNHRLEKENNRCSTTIANSIL